MSYYDDYKKIRNKLKNYSKIHIFNICIAKLKQTWNLPVIELINNKFPLPMHVLLLLKWGIIYGEYPSNTKKTFGEIEFVDIYNQIKELSTLNKLLNENNPLAFHQFSRAILSHQLNYQYKNGLHGIALLEIIFCKIGLNYDFDKMFNNLCGLSVKEYITFQMVILEPMSLLNEYRRYNIDYFSNLYPKYGKDKIKCFFDLVSLDFNLLEKYLLADHNRIHNPEFESGLLSPLYHKPLYCEGPFYFPYHSALIQANIEYGVYDILKEADATNFCSPFGRAFEEYLSLSMKSFGVNHWREDEIRRNYHCSSSCDFIVQDSDSIIFIEAKSAEMYYLTRQDPQTEYFEKTLRNSVTSGYEQIFALAEHIRIRNNQIVEGKKLFGIIVTFKELMLGHPEDIWIEFMEEILKKNLKQELFINLPIPFNNIFVVSALDFDYLLAYSAKYQTSISSCLQIAIANNKSDKRIFLRDNFEGNFIGIDDIPLIKEAHDNIYNRIKDAFELSDK